MVLLADPLTSRRRMLAGLAALTVFRTEWSHAADYCVGVPSEKTPAVGEPLGDLNERVLWGVAMEAPATDDPLLRKALAAEAPKFLAIASGLKFGFLYPDAPVDGQRLRANWSECNGVVELATRLHVPLRGDCVAWNDWLPNWLTDIANAEAPGWRFQLQGYFEDHFVDVFAHFAHLPSFRWCCPVNEPFNPWMVDDGRASWRTGAWLTAFGLADDGVPAYIHRAFALGAQHRASTATALFLNESNCDNDRFGPLVRPALLRLVDSLRKGGQTVDAVGLESHLVPQWMADPDKPNWSPFVAFLKELARRDVKIFITELDVLDCSVRSVVVRDALVAQYVASFVAAALEVPAVEMVTNWDFSDKYSWLRSTAVYPNLGSWGDCVRDPPCPRPDLYDQAMKAKEARGALAATLARGKP